MLNKPIDEKYRFINYVSFYFQTSRTNLNQGEESMDSSDFPVTNLYELESRIFTDHWSIPYKREESLGKCLISATKLAEEGNYNQDFF